MRAAAMVAPLLLAGCEAEHEPAARAGHGQVGPADARGRVIDLADALTAQEELVLAQRLANRARVDGRPVMAVVIEAGRERSLEQIGWAVGGGSRPERPLMLLVDPADRRVRIEGDLAAEQKAMVASAMQPDLAAGRTAAAIERGLVRLEQLAR